MKKRRWITYIVIVEAIILVLLCGAVFAYMFSRTDYKENIFTPATVNCKVHEETDDKVTQKTSITVQNTGNIDAYLRVRLVSYWVRSNDEGGTEIVGKESDMPNVNLADGWLKGTNDTYYYQSPVAPGEMTGELLSGKIVLEADEETGYLQVVEVFAEAIQSRPEDAVENSWKVEVDGTVITEVP